MSFGLQIVVCCLFIFIF